MQDEVTNESVLSDSNNYDPLYELQQTQPGETGSTPMVESYAALEHSLETIQAMILLMSLSTWNDPSLLKNAFSLGAQIATLTQNSSLVEISGELETLSWWEWARSEGCRRTKAVAYCFLNLHSIVYNCPPRILNTEMHLKLPCSEDQWRARMEEA
jgi:hypothetical protein